MKRETKLGAILLIAALLCAVILSWPTRGGGETLKFASHYGENAVTLEASLWETEGAEYAVLICPGYSCDRQKWRPMADLLRASGFTVMSFDYAGQGASSGSIGFDNAKTDRIPEEIDDAIAVLMKKTGVDEEHIVLMGHSMGGRSILRLLHDYSCADAETELSPRNIRNAILISPEVNYGFNAQASLFAGTTDAEEYPWKDYDASCVGNCRVFLYGSTGDDIVSDEDVYEIYARITGTHEKESGVGALTDGNHEVHVIGGVLHSYLMYSPRLVPLLNSALHTIDASSRSYAPFGFVLVYLAWFLGLVGCALLLSGLTKGQGMPAAEELPVLVMSSRFLWAKALMWLPGLAAAFLICCICVVMPFGSPVMNLPYMCCIAGYGLVMAFAYRKGKFPGTVGKLPRPHIRLKGKGLWKTLLLLAALCAAVWYILRATMYRLIPWNVRLFWVLLAAVLMIVGYYVSGCEVDMLERARVPRRVKLIYNIIQYVPLGLLVLFYLVLKSYSGLIGQVQNLVLMYVFCIPMGSLLRQRSGSRVLGAVLTGFLFQTLMITSAAIIAFL